ncbi:DUF2510 domain-containing protein [Microbacterium sp. W1N]|uniref:DUF2510 domain-containing protein n=1 Tax=Microbacterium festucae TaxID=2977531 RepID=UPI0021BEDB55|nr:DUF2510 domain-containing protein [Microbacterium festucae]MCT9821014.1 DUF2510 domain-containing protein [Microbacterium festucae]
MTTPTPAGWYPDPADPSRTRWWDGAQWTENVAGGQPAAPAAPTAPAAPAYGENPTTPAYGAYPTAAGYQAAPAYQGAPAYQSGPSAPGASGDTLWIYLSIAASLLPVFSIFFIDWTPFLAISATQSPTDADVAALMTGFFAQTLLISVFSYAMIALSIVFAWLDWRELKRRGVARPFHWAFAFFALVISIGVYIIGRTVVLKRETGKGLTALWVWIATIVLAIVISIVWTVGLFAQMAEYMQYMPY